MRVNLVHRASRGGRVNWHTESMRMLGSCERTNEFHHEQLTLYVNLSTKELKFTICDTCYSRLCHSFLSILKACFLSSMTDSLCLQLAQMPRSPDLAIFVSTTAMMTTTTRLITLQ